VERKQKFSLCDEDLFLAGKGAIFFICERLLLLIKEDKKWVQEKRCKRDFSGL
jgi:hypothetical protein